ncbi:PTS glucitol/sorbitol transporter subunit IIA [Brevibacillus sp. WF146]|uniref:PTS glucitol/sorbitol transporter subunit IIA n=1 Tax=Brevibacillus sp. WF146 TaxID=319501 RepID=UPI0007EC7955|nr:PTS glucitol/sorbitol transporter subunit IIA [Brevibacillus sp. WF146]UYZ12254.1 PTS glucitol/sorbitol transporter subunit IIA [Brevibacillus sp. WF146]
MKPLFHSTIVDIGELVPAFLQENTLILFNHDVPEELRDMAVLHTRSEQAEEVLPGDFLMIGDCLYRVTSVGEKANETLKTLGHCTIKADGRPTPQLPGTIHVEERAIPSLESGTVVAFVREKGSGGNL